jgi:uncharacterized repeat protein (TIGR03803 family)
MNNPKFATVRFAVAVLAITILTLAMAVVPCLAQNAVPPTAREAAASPAFAGMLHPSTGQASNKPRASNRSRSEGRFGRRSCSSRHSPDCGGPPPGGVIYDNGPANGTVDAWTINFGYVVANSFTVGSGGTVSGFDFYVWAYPGDTPISVDWSITSQSLGGGTVYGSGTAQATSTFISSNQYGYDIDKVSVTGLNVALGSGTYWLNLQNATTSFGDPLFWDENSGPSQAAQNAVGTIASEAFDVIGECYDCGPPPPACFKSNGNLHILHSFTKQEHPYVTPEAVTWAGSLYGALDEGGNGFGLVYKISTNWNHPVFTPLYNFYSGGDPDGISPGPVIVGPDGSLYGATTWGGIRNCGYTGTTGCGTVFRLRPSPIACRTSLCSWSESALYQFAGGNDISWPNGNSVFDQAGNLYGTTTGGGTYGEGAVYQLTPADGDWTEKVIYSFTGSGEYASGLLAGKDGNLYGTTLQGGDLGYGTVFQLVPSGGGWIRNILYVFQGQADGSAPRNIVQDSSGNLYGQTCSTPLCYPSNIFMLAPSNGKWGLSVLWQTKYGEHVTGLVGKRPFSGELWGTVSGTSSGKFYYYGVYCSQDGSGWSCGQLFSGQNSFQGGVTDVDDAGDLYGTTENCGSNDLGTVWGYYPGGLSP